MAISSPFKIFLLVCFCLLSITVTVLALDPSNIIFITGGSLMGVGGLLAFPFGGIWRIPVMGVGILAKLIEETVDSMEPDHDRPPRYPCGAVVVGLPKTTSTPTWSGIPPRSALTGTKTLILEPKQTMAPCTSESNSGKRQLYPKIQIKRDRDDTHSQALVACKSTNLRGRDVQKLRGSSMQIYDRDHVVLKGSDFEVLGNVSWTKSNSTRGMIQGEHSFFVPGIDTPVEGMVLTVDENVADGAAKEAFNLLMEAVNKSHRQADLREAIEDLTAALSWQVGIEMS